MITPVRTFGYCFSYTGGIQKQLKGSLSYYKIKFESIVRSALHFEALGLTNTIVVLLYGRFTQEQYNKAKKKNKIRPDYILEALKWLMTNNNEWQKENIDLEKIRENLKNPTLINNANIENNSENNNNIEQTETFEVFFPDRTVSALQGGQENIDKFKELMKAASAHGYTLEFRNDLNKQAVHDFKDNNLINACLLQFPYGRGGINEDRLIEDNEPWHSKNIGIDEYVTHLSKISQPQFHYDLFCLILHNMKIKMQMVKFASCKVRKKVDIETFSEQLTINDVTTAIGARSNGIKIYNKGEKILSAIDSVTNTIPHSNEATKKARRNGETLQHHFGTASYFLTVNPDDENSYVVQIYSQEIIDDNISAKFQEDEEILKRSQSKQQLRIKVPGICAFYFELIIEIIIEEVLCWDLQSEKPINNKEGLFGETEAFALSIEEQARKTLHAHLQIWVKNYHAIREKYILKNANIPNIQSIFVTH